MKLTTLVKLQTSPEEHAALLKTLRKCNAACERISRTAFAHKTFRKCDLHHLTYHHTRAATDLAAGHIVCAIAKVANAYKQGADVLRTFDPTGGIVHVATDSEGNPYSGEPVKKVRKKYRRLRKLLHPKKTCSARKHLRKARKRESRFVKDVNHVISKTLVQLALDRQKALCVETLTGIRGRGNSFNRAMRTELNNWAFHQLKLFIAYKCRRAGVLLIEVDPRYSSQTCSGCGHCERGNRKSQESFECLCCGLKLNADVNAALNLKARGELSAALMFREEARASN